MSEFVDIRIDEGVIQQMNEPSGVIGRAMERGTDRLSMYARSNIDAKNRVKTGFMRDSTHPAFISADADGSNWQVGSDASYTIFQEAGTSRGIEPAYFMKDALQSLTVGDFIE